MYNVLFYVDTVNTTLYRMIYWVINTCIKCFFVPCRHCRHNSVWNVLRSTVFMSTLLIHAFSAVRTVAAGHRMLVEGWTLFEKTYEEVGPGELPHLEATQECNDSFSRTFNHNNSYKDRAKWKKRCSSQQIQEHRHWDLLKRRL